MRIKKKAVFAGLLIVAGALWAVPGTRDEIDWYWTESRDQAADYENYLANWPHGRHAAEAKLRNEQRIWGNTKRAMINEALKKNKAEQSDPEARQARKARLEQFFWKQVTNENTAYSYKDYLMRYPNGEHAPEARRRASNLGAPGNDTSAPPAASQ